MKLLIFNKANGGKLIVVLIGLINHVRNPKHANPSPLFFFVTNLIKTLLYTTYERKRERGGEIKTLRKGRSWCREKKGDKDIEDTLHSKNFKIFKIEKKKKKCTKELNEKKNQKVQKSIEK